MESVCKKCQVKSHPLIRATNNGHEECVLSLIQAGANVNERDAFHCTALINAVNGNMQKCVAELIKAGADVNQGDCEGFTPLIYGAMRGKLPCVKMLIDAGANLDDGEMRNGRTALIAAASNGYHECVDALIEAGADVNIGSASGCTALLGNQWGSSDENHYRCIESIIASGADVNVSDDFGRNSGYLALLQAGSAGDARKIRLYLKAGVYINDTYICGHSPLEELIKSRKKNEDNFKEVALLLQAAGEKIADATVGIPDYLKPTMCLKDTCRRAIRNCLIELDPKSHLFERIPQLELPDILTNYLLYDMSVETSKKQEQDAGNGDSAPAATTDDAFDKGKSFDTKSR